MMEKSAKESLSNIQLFIKLLSSLGIFKWQENFIYNKDKSIVTVRILESIQIKIASLLGICKFNVILKSELSKVNQVNSHSQLVKELKSKVPNHEGIHYLFYTRNKAIVVKTKTAQCASELLEISELCGIKIQASLQQETISCRFILHNIPVDFSLSEVLNEVIKNDLFPLKAYRFYKKAKNGSKIPTKSVLVTVIGVDVPKDIKIWQKNHQISLFIDKPKQCLRCWRFNHSTANCKYPKRCVKCGEGHILKKCTALEPICCNCNANHFCNDKKCPKWSEEKEFLYFKSINHVPIVEARKLFAEEKRS